MEKFWAFMKYYKNAPQLEVSDKLQGYLNQFKTIEDFRVEEPELSEMQQSTKRRPRSLSENETTAQNAVEGGAVAAAAATSTASSVRN